MYVVTQSNKIINFDTCLEAFIHTTRVGISQLKIFHTVSEYIVFSGTKEETEAAFKTLCEALSKGASMISFSEVYK